MRKLVLVIVQLAVFGFFSSGFAQGKPKKMTLEQEIIGLSAKTWDVFAKHDKEGYKSLTAPDFESFTQGGPSNLKTDLVSIDTFVLKSHKVINPKVAVAGKDVAILRYRWEPDGTYDGKKLLPCYITEVWVKRNGKWVTLSYQETVIQ